MQYNINQDLLKSFILYTQFIETLYHDWKSYWMGVLLK